MSLGQWRWPAEPKKDLAANGHRPPHSPQPPMLYARYGGVSLPRGTGPVSEAESAHQRSAKKKTKKKQH